MLLIDEAPATSIPLFEANCQFVFSISDELLDNPTLYYDHVYRGRDSLIYRYATRYGLEIKGKWSSSILSKPEYKIKETKLILDSQQLLGTNIKCCTKSSNNRFWLSTPQIPFQAIFPINKKNRPKSSFGNGPNNNEPQDKTPKNDVINQSGLLTNENQKSAASEAISKWSRSNVRSFSDHGQLSFTTISKYWSFLKRKKYTEQLIISLLSLLIGISKDRWLTYKIGTIKDLSRSNIIIDLERSLLIYVVTGGASNFQPNKKEIADSEKVEISLPTNITKLIKHRPSIINKGLKDDYCIRAFAKDNPGPTPTINRTARSGLLLLKNEIFSKSQAFSMAGKIPIEFQARNCYISRNNQMYVNQFNKLIHVFLKKITPYLKNDSSLADALNFLLKPNKIQTDDNFLNGSQLGTEPLLRLTPWSKSRLSPVLTKHPDKEIQTDRTLDILNTFELYYYWMLQYAYANRPSGERTNSISTNNYFLHHDKDSKKHFESKLLLTNPILSKQYTELVHCRKRASSIFRSAAIITDEPYINFNYACEHRIVRKKRLINLPLSNSTAAKRYELEWKIKSKFNRYNFSRHQCASFIDKQNSETLADIWMGHHIDGWNLFAPESSGSTNALNTILDIQSSWLKQLGFKLLKNPLL
mgnify:FL=1